MTDREKDASKEEEGVEAGVVIYKYRLPAELRDELKRQAKLEGITLRELLTRATMTYFAFDPAGQKSGTYYEVHEPGEPPQRIKFPFWPIRKR